MAAMAPRHTAYYRQVRAHVQSLWASINGLVEMQREWNALDYGNTLANATADDGDLNGITKTEIGACVFDSANAIVTDVLNDGHATNLANLL